MIRLNPTTTLLVVALEDELPRDLAAGWQIVYSGVGKVNAAITLCDALVSYSPNRLSIMAVRERCEKAYRACIV